MAFVYPSQRIVPFVVSLLPLTFSGSVGSCLSRDSGCCGCSILPFAAFLESLALPSGCSLISICCCYYGDTKDMKVLDYNNYPDSEFM